MYTDRHTVPLEYSVVSRVHYQIDYDDFCFPKSIFHNYPGADDMAFLSYKSKIVFNYTSNVLQAILMLILYEAR